MPLDQTSAPIDYEGRDHVPEMRVGLCDYCLEKKPDCRDFVDEEGDPYTFCRSCLELEPELGIDPSFVIAGALLAIGIACLVIGIWWPGG